MLWLVWRQHRWQLLTVAAVTAAYCGYLIWVAWGVPAAIDECRTLGGACDAFNLAKSRWDSAILVGNLLPLAAGVFWGAPLLAREVEQGTIRLVLTQSVSRRGWLSVKLGVLAAAAGVFGVAVGLTVSWAAPRLGSLSNDWPFGNDVLFSQAGVVPVATWVCALLVGAALGAGVRRLMPTVAVTLAVLVLGFAGLVALRPHLIPPVVAVAGAERMMPDPWFEASERGWLYRVSYLDSGGRELTSTTAGELCADPANSYPTAECLARTGLRQRAVYQPLDRYVWFQAAEAGLLLVVSAGLALAIRRRLVNAV
ncbi:transporter [Asanoa ishikariensis]|uniref:ABC-2 family transporter protein n=1 Tax=Asanoa ishikariensis TaxID=137265 RepID=A0A1H3UIA3_9ACTN|nr:hypothetical protein [Asanoa ishikariensis]GIF63475.1 transporter [Asanoa ishikariensis]SDZ62027.1 hypothetical protein SAMN05421684_7363 [Asanoa ishikariensis]